jgi:hypothetical protein
MRHPSPNPHTGGASTRLAAGITSRALAGRGDPESGQATTEYALVLLAAAFVGLLVVGWATTGAGAATVGRLFDRIMRAVIDQT